MKIGINASITEGSQFGRVWREKTYEKLHSFGFSDVDLSCIGSNYYLSLPEKEAKDLLLKEKNLAEAANMRIHQAHAPVIAKAQPYTDEDRQWLTEGIKRSIRLCGTIDCGFLVIHPFMVNGWSDRQSEFAKDTFEQNVELTAILAEYAAEHGVTLCYENMPCVDFSISHPHEIIRVVKAVNHPNLGVCFDIGHTTAFKSDKTVGDEINEVGAWIKVLHVHDTYGMADQHNLPGMGATDWYSVKKGLMDVGFQGVFSLEINDIFPVSERIFADIYQLAYKISDEIINQQA